MKKHGPPKKPTPAPAKPFPQVKPLDLALAVVRGTERAVDQQQMQRQQEVRESNHSWDELEEMNRACRLHFSDPDPLTALMRRADVMGLLTPTQRGKVNSLAIKMTEDVHAFTAEINEIHALHRGKTGGELDPDLFMDSLAITGKYMDWMQRFETVITNTVKEAMEFIYACAKNNQTSTQDNESLNLPPLDSE